LEVVMPEAARLPAGRRAVAWALLVMVVVAGLLGGRLFGSGPFAPTAVPAGQVLANDGTIIVEN
jgi:hypothetical protein